MKKTLNTLINTGLFMLCFSHSHGLALVYNLNDVLNQGEPNFVNRESLLDTTHPEFDGIDDTFDGRITFNFTITYDRYSSGGVNHAQFVLFNNDNLMMGIGNQSSEYWNGQPANNPFGDLNLGTNPVVEGQSQAFTLTIDYNAGALDTGTVVLAGDPTVYNLVDFDYSFDHIYFITYTSNDPYHIASATNMSVSIVPEPATYALLSGALALVFVALRRRFKD